MGHAVAPHSRLHHDVSFVHYVSFYLAVTRPVKESAWTCHDFAGLIPEASTIRFGTMTRRLDIGIPKKRTPYAQKNN